MKAFLSIFVSLLLVLGIFVSVYAYANGGSTSSKLFVPIPELLVSNFYNYSPDPHIFVPSKKIIQTKEKKPAIQASAAISYDLITNQVLFEKNSDKKLPMASLTKVMTAIVAVENISNSKRIKISDNAARVGENSMGLTAGEELLLEDLLYGIFLTSGNDAAEAVAEASAFGRDNFVYHMNKKAEVLGLSNTRFTNPSGLEGDGKQYSTARDLLVLTEYALRYTAIAKAAATYNHFIPYSLNHKAFDLYNETNLLTTYPGVKGFKTGFTYEAGLCLITYLEYKNHKIIAVVLNSPSRREEMIEILDYSLKSLGVTPPKRG